MLFAPTRYKHFAAMILIGDGIMALIHPQKDALAWKRGPEPWKKIMHELHERPMLTRAIGLTQVIGGVLWAMQQEKHEKIRA